MYIYISQRWHVHCKRTDDHQSAHCIPMIFPFLVKSQFSLVKSQRWLVLHLLYSKRICVSVKPLSFCVGSSFERMLDRYWEYIPFSKHGMSSMVIPCHGNPNIMGFKIPINMDWWPSQGLAIIYLLTMSHILSLTHVSPKFQMITNSSFPMIPSFDIILVKPIFSLAIQNTLFWLFL